MDVHQLENKLERSLANDRRKRARQRWRGDTCVVTPSGVSCGLALHISLITGETDEAIMNRVGGTGSEGT